MILVVLLASVAISLGLAALIVRRGRERADRALAPVGAREQTTAATALGRTAADDAGGDLTSTGTLVLTGSEVAFAQWRPLRLLRIDRGDLTRVDTTREHLGKTMRSDVLRLAWLEDGTEQQVAFFVRDLDPWLGALGGRRSEPPAG